jgi:hypothetical protein
MVGVGEVQELVDFRVESSTTLQAFVDEDFCTVVCPPDGIARKARVSPQHFAFADFEVVVFVTLRH